MTEQTPGRVPAQTAREVNERLAEETLARLRRLATAPPEELAARLKELEAEWDIERKLETNASTVMLTSALLAAFVDRRWLWLTGAVAAFLLQHAVQGWCPPLPLFRRAGTRTAHEIERERYAIKAMRGDLRPVDESADPEAAWRAVPR